MPLTGDMKRMGQLATKLGRLARVPAQVAKTVAPEIARRIEHEFDSGTDPYGRAWSPLLESTRRRGRRPPPLTDTHAMRDGIRVLPKQGAGIEITFDSPTPGIFHQGGTKNADGSQRMVARKILPEGTFPKTWNDSLRAAASSDVKRTLGGK